MNSPSSAGARCWSSIDDDATRDGVVNLNDFNVLAANFGGTDKTFSQGDFTYDGLLNLADFNILASRFGQTAAPGAAAVPAPAPPPSLGSHRPSATKRRARNW